MALVIDGDRTTGELVRNQNVIAAVTIANIVKSSLGPVGLDKMLVDDVGDVTVSNDGATILKLLEVEHPAARVLCELANLQDDEVGDGTTSVVLIAAELLKNANELIKLGIHPTTIISGYRLACKEACKYMTEQLFIKSSELGAQCLPNVAKTSLSSKVVGCDSEFFSDMVVKAAQAVKIVKNGTASCPIKSINILKAHGSNMKDSTLINGYALNCTVVCEGMPKQITDAKIACLDFGLMKAKMNFGVQVLISDPDKLEAVRKRESDIAIERCKKIIAAGANVVLLTGGIDDLCMKYFVEAKVMAVRRVNKVDLKRIAQATGATKCLCLANMDGEESFDVSYLGHADEVIQKQISDDELIIINGPKEKNAASIILRGPNDNMCDEMERSIHDALCAVKRVIESENVVVGGGAVESALSIHLDSFASTLASKEQLAIAEFAKSLLCIPKILSVNGALDASDLTAKLCAFHYKSQNDASLVNLKWHGLNLYEGTIVDNRNMGIFETATGKIKMLKFATEAAITILRIDDMICLAPEQKGPRDDECQ